ncbi:MAG: hypothetical protein ABJP34_12875 [Erythrobacter sp.]
MATTFPSSEIQPGKETRPFAFMRSEAFLPALAAAFIFTLQVHLALTRSINWDEFHFLGQLHNFTRGELTLPMQTLHVRMFAWLAPLDMAGVDQIRIARLFMLAAEGVTCGAIVMIARRFVSLPFAIMCALAYLSAGYVMQHGWSFRTDPMATALSMSALAILARSRFSLGAIAVFALLMGTAFMVTIKIVLFAPAFAGIAWLRWSEDQFTIRRAVQIAAGPIAAMAVAAALFAWHSLGLAPAGEAAKLVSHSGESMFSLGGSPNLRYFVYALGTAIPLTLALAILPVAIGQQTKINSAEKIALAGMTAMIVTPLYYINTFPYFFAFMLAPIAAALGVAMQVLSDRYGRRLLIAVMAGWAAFIWVGDGESELDKQRTIQMAANQMFTEPVNYLDFPGYLPRHRKANFFLTGWGLRNYVTGNRPKFTEILSEKPIPMLAAIDPERNPSLLSAMTDIPRGFEFFPEDLKALKTTYRQLWGPLYVAGVELTAGETREWRVWVPGTYTADAAITVNGTSYAKGDYVDLKRGKVSLIAPADKTTGLIWGKDTKAPDIPVPQRPYWTDF